MRWKQNGLIVSREKENKRRNHMKSKQNRKCCLKRNRTYWIDFFFGLIRITVRYFFRLWKFSRIKESSKSVLLSLFSLPPPLEYSFAITNLRILFSLLTMTILSFDTVISYLTKTERERGKRWGSENRS